MTGLDKITSQIQEEAEASAKERLDAANKEAEQILADAQAACKVMEQEALEKAAAEKANQDGRAHSAAEQKRKTALLQTKQEIIAEVIGKAYETLKNEDTKSYFLTMEKLLNTYVPVSYTHLFRVGYNHADDTVLRTVIDDRTENVDILFGQKTGDVLDLSLIHIYLKLQKAHEDKLAAQRLEEAKLFAAEIAKAEVVLELKVGEGGKLFGAVSSKEIAQAAKEQLNMELDKKKLVLPNPIKTVGTTSVSVKLHPQVTAELKVVVKEA